MNILPQKRWNVYNFDNREKVKKDEEAAAEKEKKEKEEQVMRDGEIRRLVLLERVKRRKIGSAQEGNNDIALLEGGKDKHTDMDSNSVVIVENGGERGHINLFEGLLEKKSLKKEETEKSFKEMKKMRERGEGDEEKYALGYGAPGIGAKKPWYLEEKGGNTRRKEKGRERESKEESKMEANQDKIVFGGRGSVGVEKEANGKNNNARKKSMDELRRERIQRERKERERTISLLAKSAAKDSSNLQNGRQPRYHSGFGFGR